MPISYLTAVLSVLVLLVPFARLNGQWVASGLERIGPADPPKSASQVVLYAAQGEYEPFQLIVRASQGNLTNVNISVSDLAGPGNSSISRGNITLYREHYVYISHPSLDYKVGNRSMGAGWYPDGLIPFVDPGTGKDLTGAALDAAPFNLNANTNQPIWIDIFVPRGATPGQYYGTASITSDQSNATVPISLTVWHFSLPIKPSLKSSFGMHEPLSSDIRAQQLLLTHKLMPFVIAPSNGRQLIDSFGLDATGLYFFSNSSRSKCTMDAAPTSSAVAAQAARYPSDLPNYIYSADEIDPCPNLFETVKEWAQRMHQVGVPNLATITPNPLLYDDGSGTGRSAVDIWVVLPGMYNSAPDRVAEVIRKGDQVWSYNAEAPDAYSPRWQIDFNPINYRIQAGFISQVLGLTGLLYWRVDFFSSDPWNNVEAYQTGNAVLPGEGMLVYPGAQVGLSRPVPSMRLKYLREGVEDYEYVEIAKSMGIGDWALSVAQSVAPDWTNWTRNAAALEAARVEIGQELDRIASGAPSPNAKPPVLSQGSPSGAVTQQPIQMSVSTDKNATCRYSSAPGKAFAAMTADFTTTGGARHATTLPDLPAATHRYYVRCQDAGGVKNASDYPITFTVNQTAKAPSKPSPANGATNVAAQVALQWTGTAGATSYEVYAGASVSGLSNRGSTAPTRYTLSGLPAKTKTYWKVVAKGPFGSLTSPVWSFTTAPPPGAATKPNPANGATAVPRTMTFTWQGGSNATSYLVYRGASSGSLKLLGTTSTKSYASGTLSPATKYYWRVESKNASGATASAVWNLRTK